MWTHCEWPKYVKCCSNWIYLVKSVILLQDRTVSIGLACISHIYLHIINTRNTIYAEIMVLCNTRAVQIRKQKHPYISLKLALIWSVWAHLSGLLWHPHNPSPDNCGFTVEALNQVVRPKPGTNACRVCRHYTTASSPVRHMYASSCTMHKPVPIVC